MSSDIVQRYHEILTPEVAGETEEQLLRCMEADGLVFDGRPLCTVLRPRLLMLPQYRQLQTRIRPLLAAFARAHARALEDVHFRSQFRLAEWEEQLVSDRPPYDHPSPTSRLDLFWDEHTGASSLTEYNAETPAGAAYCDALADAFLDTSAMRAFAHTHMITPLPARHGVVGALLDAFHSFRGTRERPSVAILDWDDVPTRTEFELYRRHFAGLAIPCVIDDPRRCEYRNGKLYAAGAHVTLIYKRVLISELVEQCGMDSPVVRAVRDRAVCMVDGFHCKVLHKKASLAVLSDEVNESLFSPSERRAIADIVPWTRVLRERHTRIDGEEIDLVSFVLQARERLVLKPNDDYGGKGITLGWTVDDAQWARAVAEALAAPFIVQERVPIPSESYPSLVNGRVEYLVRQYDTAPFVTNGDYMDGLLTRLSTAALLNVTAGGGSTVPTFLAEPR